MRNNHSSGYLETPCCADQPGKQLGRREGLPQTPRSLNPLEHRLESTVAFCGEEEQVHLHVIYCEWRDQDQGQGLLGSSDFHHARSWNTSVRRTYRPPSSVEFVYTFQ